MTMPILQEAEPLYATPQERARIHAALNKWRVPEEYRKHYWSLLEAGILNPLSIIDLIEARESLRS